MIASAHPFELADVALRDGRTVAVRPARAGDRAGVRAFLEGICAESLSLRFFGSPNLDQAADLMVGDTYGDTSSLIVLGGRPAKVVAHAGYVRIDAGRAEVAFLVADAWQGLGIAPILLARLMARAETEGIGRLLAEVLPRNHRMLAMFERTGRARVRHADRDGIEVEIAVRAPAAGLAAGTSRR